MVHAIGAKVAGQRRRREGPLGAGTFPAILAAGG